MALRSWSAGVMGLMVACSGGGGGSSSSGGGGSGGGGSGGGGGTRTLTVDVTGSDRPVTLAVAIPSSWKDSGSPGNPMFSVPGVDGGLVSLAALSPSGDTAERLAKAIRLQYEAAEAASARREELTGGRVWIEHRGDGGRVHARMFVPFDDGVVMGVAMLTDPDGTRLPAIRAVWETIAVVPATAPAP